jgi:glycosyltransferase involved in cell wall biosynthesis
MNIVYFVTEDSYFLSHRLPIALQAKKQGHKVFIVTRITNKQKEIEKYGFHLISLNFSRSALNLSNDIHTLLKLIKVLREISADIIHNVAIKPIIIGSLSSLFCKNIRIVNAFTGMGFLFTSRLTLKYTLLRFIVKLTLIRIVNLKNAYSIVQNEGDRNFLKNNFYAKTDKIILISGSGVDTNFFKPSIKNKNARNKKLRVVTTCRMLKDKGVLDFYEAAVILKNRGVPCTCVFVGGLDLKNPSSIGKERLKKWIQDGIIEYHGQTSNILSILKNSDIFTLVSYREGLSKSILEAASIGLPIIATNIPASEDLIIENSNGFLVPIKNAFDLANSIEKLVFDHNLRAKFGKSSRSIVLKNFSEEVVCKKTLDFYHAIIT